MNGVLSFLDVAGILFLKVLNMSITASYVILAVLLVRLCIGVLFPEVPKKYSYWLWIAVAFRLACPWSLDSQWSLFRWEVFDMSQVQEVGSAQLEYIPLDADSPEEIHISVGIPAVDEMLQENGQALTHRIRVQTVTAVWLAGVTLLIMYGVISCLRLQRRMEKAILLRDNIYQSEWVRSPFILGILRPRIYIPFHLEDEDLAYVLDHERTHLKRGDHCIKLLSCLLLAVHWFNPLVWMAFAGMCKDMELSCDENVLSRGENIRKAYSETLLYLSVHQKHLVYSPLAFGETSVKARIKNVLQWKNPKLSTTIGTGIACILVVMLCAANPIKPTPQDDIFGEYLDNPDFYVDYMMYYRNAGRPGNEMMLYISSEGELFLEQDPIWMEDPVEWMSAGMLEEIRLTKENFTDYFYYNGGSRPGSWIEYDSNPFTKNGATRYRRNNWKAWRTIVDSRMFYILQQRMDDSETRKKLMFTIYLVIYQKKIARHILYHLQ